MTTKVIIKFIPRIIAVFILIQTLYFKFGIGGVEALNESKEIFSKIAEDSFGDASYESYMRIGTGILELVASILILFNGTVVFGAILCIGLMGGAILSHIFVIGIVVRNDGGQLFIMSLIALLCCVKIIFDEKDKILNLLKKQ